jgi:hypothetical protein
MEVGKGEAPKTQEINTIWSACELLHVRSYTTSLFVAHFQERQ